MANDILDILDTHLEKVRSMLQPMYETSTVLADMIGNTGETVKVSRYLYRIPLKLYPSGIFSKYTANAGVLGRGNNMVTSKLQAGYFYSKMAITVNEEQIDTTGSSDQAVINFLNEELAEMMTSYKVMDDITLHTDGTGVLTNASSNYTSNVFTFATASDDLSINRLREGMTVDVWNSALSTKRGTTRIVSINYTSKAVTTTGGLTSPATGDRFVISAVDAYGPSTPTSFASGWPTPVASQVAAGLSGDSFRHGLEYINDATAANYYLGLQKSAVPQLMPAYVNAGGAVLNYSHALKLWSQLQQRRDGDGERVMQGVLGLMHMAQRDVIFQQSVAIANKDLGANTKFGRSVDFLPENFNYADMVDFGGVACRIDKRQRKSRVDFFNPSKWGRAELKGVDFIGVDPNGAGSKFHRMVDPSTGTPKAEWSIYLNDAKDWYCVDPASGGYIDGAQVPSGY